MAAKGATAKSEIGTKILETFDGSFIDADRKTIRIPWIENGDLLEIKITMTAAKDIIGGGASPKPQEVESAPAANTEITTEEKQEVVSLIEKLGL